MIITVIDQSIMQKGWHRHECDQNFLTMLADAICYNVFTRLATVPIFFLYSTRFASDSVFSAVFILTTTFVFHCVLSDTVSACFQFFSASYLLLPSTACRSILEMCLQ